VTPPSAATGINAADITNIPVGTGGVGIVGGSTVSAAGGVFINSPVSAELTKVLLIVGNIATIRRRLAREFKAVFWGPPPSSVTIQREGIRLSAMFDAVDRSGIDVNHFADCLTVTAAIKCLHNHPIGGSLDSLIDCRRAVPF
jgi:hypothetical protein